MHSEAPGKDLHEAMRDKDYHEIMRQVDEAERAFLDKLNQERSQVESDNKVQAIAEEITNLCKEIIDLGKMTPNELTGVKGHFSSHENKIKEAVLKYEKIIRLKFHEYRTALSGRLFPTYIVSEFLNKTKFPYLTVEPKYETDRRTNDVHYFIEVKLDNKAIVDAINAQ